VSLRTWLRLVALTAALVTAQGAQALCVLCICTVTTTSMVFAPQNPLSSSNNDSTGNVRVTCGGVASIALTYTVALSAGVSNAMTSRQMSNGANRLGYNLYTSNTFGTVWGDGTGGTAMGSGGFALDLAGLAPPQDLTVYGRIPGGQSGVVPGSYSDTLVVTVSYF
jgi:spore coat protein U-like protein